MSEVKVNKISPRSGTTVTLGDSGDTFTIPAGATINNQGTATNFGATGSASWTTTVKTNSDSGFTAVAGEGYFLNTTSGTISVNLPAGTPGAVVAFKDYLGTFDTNAVTLVQNGSDKIGGSTVNGTLNTEGLAVTLVFIDSTQGWLVTDSGLQSEAPTAQYISATGGTTTTCGDFKIHTFTGPGTFCVSAGGNAGGSNSVEYIVTAGGGGGGGKFNTSSGGAGGGAGGFRFASPSLAPGSYPAKPLAGPANLPVSVQGYPITVGGGGAAGALCRPGCNGANSVFSTITSTGGGGGSGGGQYPGGGTGGSGGGTSLGNPTTPCGTALAGNTPLVSPPQGNPGGAAIAPGNHASGGGGAIGTGSQVCSSTGGPGGAGGGLPTAFGSNGESCGSFRYYAGGGAGGGYNCGANGIGGVGGGGNAYTGGSPPTSHNATDNTGGGAGGVGAPGVTSVGGVGGSGIVIIRYKFQN